jgi:protein SCO1/2
MVSLALCAAGGGMWLSHRLTHRSPQLASGTWLEPRREVGSFTLTDQNGHAFTRSELAGAPTLVFFGFTHCPDVCPTTLYKLAQLQKSQVLPQLRVVFVSVDPERDQPAALKQYLSAFATTSPAGVPQPLIGLTGSSRAIAGIAAHLGVAYERVPLPGGDYTMDHSAVLFLLDDAGRLCAVFTLPFDVSALAADLRRAAPHLHG